MRKAKAKDKDVVIELNQLNSGLTKEDLDLFGPSLEEKLNVKVIQPKAQNKPGLFTWFRSKNGTGQPQRESADKNKIIPDIGREKLIKFCDDQLQLHRKLYEFMASLPKTGIQGQEFKERENEVERNYKALLYLQVILFNPLITFKDPKEEKEVFKTLFSFRQMKEYQDSYPPMLAYYADHPEELEDEKPQIAPIPVDNEPIPTKIIAPPEKEPLTKADFIEFCEEGKKTFSDRGTFFTGNYNDDRAERWWAYSYLKDILESKGTQYNQLQAPENYQAERRAVRFLLQDQIAGPKIKEFIEFWPPVVHECNKEIQSWSNYKNNSPETYTNT